MHGILSTHLYGLTVTRIFISQLSQLKKVEAEVRRERFEDVDFALQRIGVPGLTVAQEERASRGMWGYPLEKIRHLLLTVVVDDGDVARVVDSIRGSASTKSWGDGRISVSTIEGALDIGSGLSDRCELAAPTPN